MIKFIKNLFTPKPKYIWQQVNKVFLREEEEIWNAGGAVDINNWYVYAIYQRCIETGKTRVLEKYQMFPDVKQN